MPVGLLCRLWGDRWMARAHRLRLPFQRYDVEETMSPDVLWVAIAPGVMELPTTKFRITFVPNGGSFHLNWDGGGARSYGDLQSAKDGAARWMADMIEMGIEV